MELWKYFPFNDDASIANDTKLCFYNVAGKTLNKEQLEDYKDLAEAIKGCPEYGGDVDYGKIHDIGGSTTGYKKGIM